MDLSTHDLSTLNDHLFLLSMEIETEKGAFSMFNLLGLFDRELPDPAGSRECPMPVKRSYAMFGIDGLFNDSSHHLALRRPTTIVCHQLLTYP